MIEARRIAAQSGILLDTPRLFGSARPSLAQRRWLWHGQLVNGISALREFGVPRLHTLVANTMRLKVFRRAIRCRHPWELMVLDLDGNARPCMNWASETPLGNCSHQSRDEIWTSDAFVQLRNELTGRAPLRQNCRHCHALSSGRVDEDSAFEKVSL